jgi:hypothetical protein
MGNSLVIDGGPYQQERREAHAQNLGSTQLEEDKGLGRQAEIRADIATGRLTDHAHRMGKFTKKRNARQAVRRTRYLHYNEGGVVNKKKPIVKGRKGGARRHRRRKKNLKNAMTLASIAANPGRPVLF